MFNLVGVYSISMTVYEVYIDEMMRRFGLEYYKENETMHVIEASIFSSAITVLLMNFMEVIVVRRQSGSK